MSPNAFRIAALLAACLAASSCAPDRRGAVCGRTETVSVDFSEQVCFAGAEGYEACQWIPRTHIVTIPATCEPAVTIRERPLVPK